MTYVHDFGDRIPTTDPSVMDRTDLEIEVEVHRQRLKAIEVAALPAPIHLTPIQYRLWEALYAQRGKVVTTKALETWVYGDVMDPPDKPADNLRTNICYMRRKLKQSNTGHQIITVGYVGYRLVCP